jgi:hypothetical protein
MPRLERGRFGSVLVFGILVPLTLAMGCFVIALEFRSGPNQAIATAPSAIYGRPTLHR